MKLHRQSPAFFIAITVLAITAMGAAYPDPVPAGTALSVHLLGSLSSSSASPGQTFDITAAKPLLVQGRVVVFEGTKGQGHVVAVTKASAKSKPSVVVQFDWIIAADGKQLPLAASSTSKGFGTLTLGATGPFADLYAKAKSIEVGPDLVLQAYVSSDQTVMIASAF